MTVPRKITIHTTQEESIILTSRKEHTRTHKSWVQYISLDREVLTPSLCEYRIDTDVNSLAYETVMESYANNTSTYV